jgi:hypothetical protein
MIKLPNQFRALFTDSVALAEELGEAMAKWAAGTLEGPAGERFARACEAIEKASTMTELEELQPELEEIKAKKLVPPAQYNLLRSAWGERKKALAS